MEVVPGAHAAFLPLDNGDAFPGEDEKALLFVLGVVLARCLAGEQDMDTDPES
jgi:hypothetical protein